MFKYEHILKLDKQQMFKSKSSKKKKNYYWTEICGTNLQLIFAKIHIWDRQAIC